MDLLENESVHGIRCHSIAKIMDRMPNHTVLRELSTTVHAMIRRKVIQEVVFIRFAQGYLVPRYRRVLPDSRETRVPEFPVQVPAFFGRNVRNRLISRRGDFGEKKKKREGRRWRRANQRTKAAVVVAAVEEEKEEKKTRDSRRSRLFASPHDSRTLRGSASVVLVPPGL